jgi:hypothetical protein
MPELGPYRFYVLYIEHATGTLSYIGGPYMDYLQAAREATQQRRLNRHWARFEVIETDDIERYVRDRQLA